MQLRKLLILGAFLLAGCMPGTLIYLGPEFATVRGAVFSLEGHTPLPGAEVCLYGSDTTCVRANDNGEYRIFLAREETVTLRYRVAGARPAVIMGIHLTPPEVVILNCTLSTRLTLSTEPGACRVGTD
ncbi:MAG: carboxypeptidase-like regulatory domain-containing protein [Gemmatimonadales bacterium]